MADKFDKINDAENITSDVDIWQSNKRHTENEFKEMFKSPTLKLLDRVNDKIDDINERIMSTELPENVRINGSLQSRIAQNENDIDKLQSYEPHVKELADAAALSAKNALNSEINTIATKKAMDANNAATIAETNAIKESALSDTLALKNAAEAARDTAQKFAVDENSFTYNGITYYSARHWAELSRGFYENRNKALAFDTTQQALDWYDGKFTRADGLTKENLVIGDLIFIKTVGVPDAWYCGGECIETDEKQWWVGYPFSQWEGDKVALQEFTERAELACDKAELTLTRAQEASTEAEAAKTAALSAQAGSETARDDARTAANNSATSVIAAKASETASKVSETNAKSSEDKSKASETNAKISENKTSEYMQSASALSDAAALSASAAEASAIEADTKAQAAARSETNASASAATAGQHKTAAEAAKTAAEIARTAAQTSATAAATSATEAKTSETNAAASANDSNSSSTHSETQAEAALAAAVRAEAAAQRTEAIANGLQKKLPFDTVQDVLDWYNNDGTITVNGQSYTPADLRVGDDIYVIETGVSDVWYVGEGKNETDSSLWWYGLPFTYLETNSEELIGYSEEAKAARDAAKTSETLSGQYAAQAQVNAGSSETSRLASEAAKTAAEAAKNAAIESESNAADSAIQAKTDADYLRSNRDSIALIDGTYPNLGAGKDGNGNIIADTYATKDEAFSPNNLPNWEQVTTKPEKYDRSIQPIFNSSYGDTKIGYLKLITIDVGNAYYVNSPLYFLVSQRDFTPTYICLKFASVAALNPGVKDFYYYGGNSDIWYAQSGSKTDIYVAKAESYDQMSVSDCIRPGYVSSLNITFSSDLVSTLPSGAVRAKKYIGYTPQDIGAVKKTGDVMTGSLGVDTINGATLENAMLRQLTNNGNIVVGSTLQHLRLVGNEVRPKYSNDDADETTYSELALVSDLSPYAQKDESVLLEGDQTINGNKTFSRDVTIKGENIYECIPATSSGYARGLICQSADGSTSYGAFGWLGNGTNEPYAYIFGKRGTSPSWYFPQYGIVLNAANELELRATNIKANCEIQEQGQRVYSPNNLPQRIEAIYTANGGQQPPSYVGTNSLKCNMMDGFMGASGYTDLGYMDVLLMNAYSWSDVPYATALGIKKVDGAPRAYIASGGNTDHWSGATMLYSQADPPEYVKDYGNEGLQKIYIGYSGAGVSQSEFLHFAAYKIHSNGGYDIKDMSASTAKKVLGVPTFSLSGTTLTITT